MTITRERVKEHKEAIAARAQLRAKGYDLPPSTDIDEDDLSNLLTAAERAIALEEALPSLVSVKETCAGPELMIAGVRVRSWLGTAYNAAAADLAADVRDAIAAALATANPPA